MTETLTARIRLDRARTDADAARARADEQLAVVRRLQDAQRAGDPQASEALLAAATQAQADLARTADQLDVVLRSAEDELVQLLDESPPLFADHNTDPVALLPVRLETIWWEPRVLRARVYPDDLLLTGFTPELTAAEAAAGNAYWQDPSPAAWQELRTRLRPARASWAARACRPGEPPPTLRPDDEGLRRRRLVHLPKRWRFLGVLDGEVVVDKPGRAIPDPLPIGLLRAEEEGWETSWFEALKAGMAVELTFAEEIDHLDQLLVVGVREGSADQGAAELQDLLRGHAFEAGLGLLPPGTPTNNTQRARSGWSSAPSPPGPGPDPEPGERPVADALASALGLPDAPFLRSSPGSADDGPAVLAALSLLTWPTLGKGFAEAAMTHLDLATAQPVATDPTRVWRAVRDHLAGHVRSRGPLPTLRVGRQPYGVLPATALGDWRAASDRDLDALLAPWLQRMKDRWHAVLDPDETVPRVRPGEPVDQTAVDILQRLPVATGLAMRRMDGPGFAVPKTPRDQAATPALPGIPPDGTLRWTTQSDGWTDLGWGVDEATGVPAFVGRLTPDPTDFGLRARNTADYLLAVRSFLTGGLTADAFDHDWPVELSSGRETPPRPRTFFNLPDPVPAAVVEEGPPADGEGPLDIPVLPPPDATGLIDALLFLPNWAFMDGDEGDGDPVRQALVVTGDVDQLVADVLEGLAGDDRDERVAAATRGLDGLATLEEAFRTLAAVPVGRLPELLLEVLDVYSHRLDAWVTSLASRRLAQLRASGVQGVRYGCYGWVEDLRPPVPEEQVDIHVEDAAEPTASVSAKDGYIHAPSLQHAATAAVLRSGSLGHPGDQAYAVNLSSRRSRTARWLLGGVRQGQDLGSLLGYRFERSLHEAELDHLVERFRRQFPIPVVAEPSGPRADPVSWARSTEAIAARNVVDGIQLVRAGGGAPDLVSAIDQRPVVPPADRARVVPLLEDLSDALDAVGDLLLAESVHQLVGGSPIRAGLAADTLGRGEDVPDVFHVLRTPHRAHPVTHRVAVLLAAEPSAATGWPADPLAALQPAVEAWAAHLLGPASGWTLSGVVHEVTGQEPARAFELAADRLGLGALSIVLGSVPAGQGPLHAAVADAVQAPPATQVTLSGAGWTALSARAARVRSLLATAQPLLPSHLPGTRDDQTVDIAGLQTRLTRFVAALADQTGAAALRSVAAEPPGSEAQSWLASARAALAEVLDADLPLLPALGGPPPSARAEVAPAVLEDWLRRNGAVRPAVRTVHEALLLVGKGSPHGERLQAAQDPDGGADPWVGGPFPAGGRPEAASHLVWHAPGDLPAGGPLAGLLLDEWVELIPGANLADPSEPAAPAPGGAPVAQQATELTGVAFHYDRPDAKAPQAILVAVPPDLGRGWTSDGLVQVLRETLELAKLRAVDLMDLPLVRDLVPAVRISPDGATGQVLSAVETRRPNTDPAGPFRFEPGHRTGEVESGLAARVHDPLWLLTRQWQFGEFAAQDAGSPAVVRMAGTSTPIDAWRPAGASDWVPYDIGAGPLDVQIEDEPVLVDLRLRAEGGAALLRMLGDAGVLAQAAAVLAGHAMPASEVGPPLVDLLGDRVPDAESVAAAVASGGFGAGLDPTVAQVAQQWHRWWTDQLAGRGPDCFDPHRLEHAAELSTGGTVLRLPEYLGDGLDWYSLDVHPDAEVEGAPPGHPRSFVDEGLPSLVRYGGLPADRFWEMEDARVDLGAAELSTLDTGRLLLISFATVFGNDWFLTPLEVPAGSLTVLEQLLVRDVFGRHHLLERAGRDDPSWSMFTLHSADPDQPAASGLLVLPAGGGQIGPPLERVVLARDELANLGWAVQHHYTDEKGERVDRRDRWARTQTGLEPDPPGELPAYAVQTVVPDYWFPLVPEAVETSAFRFRLATLTVPGSESRLEGRLVAPDLWLHEEEVPRDGVTVSRRPVLARWYDGSSHGWVRRVKAPGAGETSSGLAFDTVRPTEPWPG